jgi:nicotinamidase-related amidase
LLDERFRDDDRLREPFRGTLAPFSRASLNAIAIACLRLLTLRPDPLLSVPFFRRRMADSTFFDADLPYFAMGDPPGSFVASHAAIVQIACSPSVRIGMCVAIQTAEMQEPQSSLALLLIDVINDMDFPGSDPLVAQAIPMARRLRRLKQRARDAGIPTIYINDNFGKWRSDFRTLVEHCVRDDVPGREVAQTLQPDAEDYFVLKPKHSAFYATTLDTLLGNLGTDTVIMTGIAGNICVLFSANDAYMRDLRLIVPADCIVSNTEEENAYAINQMRTILKADVTPSDRLDLDALAARKVKLA